LNTQPSMWGQNSLTTWASTTWGKFEGMKRT
jgi:hypothetical protein